MESLNEIFLLNQIAMDFETEDDGVRRSEEGVLCDSLKCVASGELRGERPSVSDYRRVVVSRPNVDCNPRQRERSRLDSLRTFYTSTALLKSSNISFDRTLSSNLVSDEVGLSRRQRQLRSRG